MRPAASPWKRQGLACFSIALLFLLPGVAHAGWSWKEFQSFASRKDSVGPVAIIADFVLVEDVKGDVDKVFPDDSRRLGGQMIAAFAEQMAQKGYQTQARPLLSVGGSYHSDFPLRVYPSWDRRKENEQGFSLGQAPFFVDTTLCPNVETKALWDTLLASCSLLPGIDWKKVEPGFRVPMPAGLHERIGSNHIFVVLARGVKTSGKMKFGLSLAGLKKPAGTLINVSLIDCQTGEVMWADWDFYEDMFIKEEKEVPAVVKNMLKHMP